MLSLAASRRTLLAPALLRRTLVSASTAARADPAAAAAADASSSSSADGKMILNLATPHAPIHDKKRVGLAVLPGVIGSYGVTAGHTPIIAELKAGLVQLYDNVGDSEPFEKFVISGGFAKTDENNVTDVMVVECVKLDQLDPELARKGLAESRAKMESAPADSQERAAAQISFEVYEAICSALGVAA